MGANVLGKPKLMDHLLEALCEQAQNLKLQRHRLKKMSTPQWVGLVFASRRLTGALRRVSHKNPLVFPAEKGLGAFCFLNKAFGEEKLQACALPWVLHWGQGKQREGEGRKGRKGRALRDGSAGKTCFQGKHEVSSLNPIKS